MARKLLINAHRPEEVRVAIVNRNTLDAYAVSTSETGLYRGNIYRGIVASIQPSLDAAFVDFGADRHGLLRAEDVVPTAAHRKLDPERRHHRIDQLLEKGKPVLVQVVRDGIGAKGALLTTNLSIAGRYLVLMPFEEARGVSRKLEDGETRGVLKERIGQLDLPDGFGVIARTNAGDQPKASLNRDLSALLRLWKKVHAQSGTGKGPRLLYSDQDLILQVLRDSLDSSIDEVLVDDDDTFEKVGAYMQTFMPRAKTRLTRYAERMPLFSRFDLEPQIDRIYQRRVELPSGGSIVIDGTEALTAIDVNSGRSRGASSQEDTAVATNLEAATEVARQLRLRDIGGLVVVDFIDMRSMKHRKDVERVLREAMKDDRAKFSVGRISSNGLLEINRQRITKELKLRTHRQCPTCAGTGSIASPELVSLSVLRRIETRAVTGRLKRVRVELHPELADALQNDHRQQIAELEREFDIRIEIVAATALHRSQEKLEWFERDREHEAPAVVSPAVTVADLAGGADSGRGEAELDEDDEPSRDAGAEPGKAKRRRRGGRRRKKGAAAEPAAEPAPADGPELAPAPAVAAGEAEPEPGGEPGGAAPSGEPAKPRRRRRGGRRHKKSAAAGEAPSEPADAITHEAQAPPSEATADGHEPGKKRRPRRRRRRKTT
jgi:ribonuclease E